MGYFKGNSTKNKIATQTLERNKLAEQLHAERSQNELELNKARRTLADAQYNITQQKAAVAQALEALRILQNRYEQGLCKDHGSANRANPVIAATAGTGPGCFQRKYGNSLPAILNSNQSVKNTGYDKSTVLILCFTGSSLYSTHVPATKMPALWQMQSRL